MAKRECYDDNFHKTPGVCYVSGSFRPNGSSAIDTTSYDAGRNPTGITGKGYSVARQGVGTYRVTIPGSFRSVVSFCPSLQIAPGSLPASAIDLTWSVVSGGTPGTSALVIDITYRAANAAADLANAATTRVHFEAELEAGR